MTPQELIQLLGATTPELGARLEAIDKVHVSKDARIEGRFYYVPLRESKPTVEDLIAVAYARMVNFAIPRWRINEALQKHEETGAVDSFVALAEEARSLFIRTQKETKRSGELGEILLFMLMEWALGAPIVACKMYLKTSKHMPVHGTDGVHLGHVGGGLMMYWGESKMHKTMASAIADILASVGEQVSDPDRRSNEVRLIRANLNLDHLELDARNALLKYFDPYEHESNDLGESYACFAGFDSPMYDAVKDMPHHQAKGKLVELYKKRIEEVFPHILTKVEEAGLHDLKFTYFLLPFPSIEAARARFQERLGGTKA